jgi:hypothetical protein
LAWPNCSESANLRSLTAHRALSATNSLGGNAALYRSAMAGGKWIRTIGPARRSHQNREPGVCPTACGCQFRGLGNLRQSPANPAPSVPDRHGGAPCENGLLRRKVLGKFRKSGDHVVGPRIRLSKRTPPGAKTAGNAGALRVVWDRNYERFEMPSSAVD